MTTKALTHRFTGTTTAITAYNQSLTNLGDLIKQYSDAGNEGKYAGPIRGSVARPMEQSTAIPGIYPHVIRWSSNIDWVFLADNAAAAATRRIVLYEFDRSTSVWTWRGFITLTYPPATNHTIRGFRMLYRTYSTGTVSVSGTAVTGVGTSWATNRQCVGSRIGFGSTDPTQITTWYQISSGSDTSITLSTSAPTLGAGTAYVIEDLQALTTTTNATATNGGLFVAKGLSWAAFTAGGTTIPAAGATDLIRAVYWLADAATVTNTAACGLALGSWVSWSNQRVYVIDTVGRVFVYNARAALTPTSGRDNTTLVLQTGNQAFTGTIQQNNNGRVDTLSHGPGNGVESLYFVTTTRICRAAVSGITAGSTTWITDLMTEVPPGSTSTYAATGALSSIEVANSIDRLVVMTSGAAGVRAYITRYNAIGSQMDRIWLIDSKQIDQSTADANSVPHPAVLALPFTSWSEGGLCYLARIGTAANTNQVYAIPIGADEEFAISLGQLLITPRFVISDATKLYNVLVSHKIRLGNISSALAIIPESYNVYYRTTGISDNTGSWTLVDETGSLSGVSATEIQFAISFKTIGNFSVPARIFSVTLSYEDGSTDERYAPSAGQSSAANRRFAYVQRTAWGSSIPNMRIRLYNNSTGALVLDDTVLTSGFGSWEYSTTEGASWSAWLSSADAVGNYIRYTATSLPAGIQVRALLTQA